MEPDKRAKWFGLSQEALEAKAVWLAEQRNLQDQPTYFFREAGKLVSFSWYHYPFASLAFFQTILALEASLRLLNGNQDRYFRDMFADVVKSGLVTDGIFSAYKFSEDPWKEYTGETFDAGFDDFEDREPKIYQPKPKTHVEVLSIVVPKLRNLYFHGNYHMSPDYLILAFQMRELADALAPAVSEVRESRWRQPT